jgi:hypothetical protein
LTVKIVLTPTHLTRKLKQDFAGCVDVEDGKRKCLEIFPGAKIHSAEPKE